MRRQHEPFVLVAVWQFLAVLVYEVVGEPRRERVERQ